MSRRLAAGISLAAGSTGALSAVRRAVRLMPAEAMRPPAPHRQAHGLLDRIPWVRGLPARWQMMLRGIAGRPLRAGFTVLAVAMAVPMMVVSQFWNDALNYMIDVQLPLADQPDQPLYLTLIWHGGADASTSLPHPSGRRYGETIRDVGRQEHASAGRPSE